MEKPSKILKAALPRPDVKLLIAGMLMVVAGGVMVLTIFMTGVGIVVAVGGMALIGGAFRNTDKLAADQQARQAAED